MSATASRFPAPSHDVTAVIVVMRVLLCLTLTAVASAEPPRPAPVGARADYHVHVKGGLTPDAALARSRADGITYGIAINGGRNQPASDDAAAEAFLSELRPHPVFVALQAEGREWRDHFSQATLERFDYIFTDAMTWSDDSGRRRRLWIPEEVGPIADPDVFMDMLVGRATRIFAEEPVDLYVNPTFIPASLQPEYDKLWTPARIRRIVDGLAASGIGMEINNRYRIPSRAVILAAKQAGVKFACGTNNTGAQDLGRNEYCAEMIAACGLTAKDFWSPPVEGKKAIQHRPLLGGALPGAARVAGAPLQVMSFNIRYGTANDGDDHWSLRREQVFDLLRERDADLVGLQEAEAFQIDEIEAAVPGYAAIGVGRDDAARVGEFTAILYKKARFRVADAGTFWFSDTPELPASKSWGNTITRICTWARFIDRDGRGFYLFNLHLDHQSQPSRERSAALLRQRIDARAFPRDPVVVTGDFNAGERNPALATLVSKGDSAAPLIDTYRILYPDETTVGTFTGFAMGKTGGEKIDYVLVQPGAEVVSAEIIRTSRNGRYPSDHFPVVATVRLRR